MERKSSYIGLSGSALKILALIFMTIDHIGYMFFPKVLLLRMIGRLALPIFAYMVAEGCQYTKNRWRYFGTVFGMAILCQIGYFVAMRSLYLSIFATFALSIIVCFAADNAREKRTAFSMLLLAGTVCTAFFFTDVMPILLPRTGYGVQYGFWGVLLPVFVFSGRSKLEKLILAAVILCFISLSMGGIMGKIEWYSLVALPILWQYNGTRGKHPLKWLFYLYYPAHLVVLYGIGRLLYR